MDGLAVFVKEGPPFAQNLSLENTVSAYIFEWLYFTYGCTLFSYINLNFFVFMHSF